MEQYKVTIESQERTQTEEGIKLGRVTVEQFYIDARSETEASTIIRQYKNVYNNVNVERV